MERTGGKGRWGGVGMGWSRLKGGRAGWGGAAQREVGKIASRPTA